MNLPRRVACLLFGSGFCALIYQVAWLREFRLIFGASTAASAAVLAIFVGGLGAGGLLLGPRADRQSRPLDFYARLEMGIAASAALTPLLLWAVSGAYVAVGGTATLGVLLGTACRLLLAALVLLVPTFLMGGTLSAASRSIASRDDEGRRAVALLYGVNTLGAVSGSFLATFWMLEQFGTRRTLWLACLVNAIVALAARQLARLPPPIETVGSEQVTITQPAAPPRFVLTAAAVVGFAFFLMELIWYRMLAPLLGGTVFTFGLILSVALLGIGLGGAGYFLLRPNRPATLRALAQTCLLEAALLALPLALGDRVATLAVVLRELAPLAQFWGYVLGWTAIAILVVLPAAIVAGYQFPLLIALLGRGREAVGRQVGQAYAWNTAGGIVGSLAGGFGLIPLLSATGAWRFVVVVLVALGLAATTLAWRRMRRGGLLAPAAALAAALAMAFLPDGPTAAWRHSGIGAGRNDTGWSSPNALQAWLHEQRAALRWQADGVESSVAVVRFRQGLAFVINGKNDGHSMGDASTMVMSGIVGAWLHPDPKQALVIGLGTGETAGWLGAIPSMQRVDVFELEPRVLEVARDCAVMNQQVLSNRRVHVTLGDARELLLVSRKKYDLISSEPSNPYRAGVASLFTQEYYRAVAARLAEQGLFLQWVQAYEVDGATLRTVYATLASVFPSVQTWEIGPDDLLLVASRETSALQVPRLRERLRQEPYATAARDFWHASTLEGFLGQYLASPAVARAVALRNRGIVNTDDLNYVEFGFARSLGLRFSAAGEVLETARARGEDRPAIAGADEVDWRQVEEARTVRLWQYGGRISVRPRAPLEERELAAFFQRFVAGDMPGALSAWTALGREPRSPGELVAVATALAFMGDEAAAAHIEKLRVYQPVTADLLTAILRRRQQRPAEAFDALERGFLAFRADPRVLPAVAATALKVAVELARIDPAHAVRAYRMLLQPLALRAHDDARIAALADVLGDSPAPECVAGSSGRTSPGSLGKRRGCRPVIDATLRTAIRARRARGKTCSPSPAGPRSPSGSASCLRTPRSEARRPCVCARAC